jgi:hypothetical protein
MSPKILGTPYLILSAVIRRHKPLISRQIAFLERATQISGRSSQKHKNKYRVPRITSAATAKKGLVKSLTS